MCVHICIYIYLSRCFLPSLLVGIRWGKIWFGSWGCCYFHRGFGKAFGKGVDFILLFSYPFFLLSLSLPFLYWSFSLYISVSKQDDPKVHTVVEKLLDVLNTPSEAVQRAVSACLAPLMQSKQVQHNSQDVEACLLFNLLHLSLVKLTSQPWFKALTLFLFTDLTAVFKVRYQKENLCNRCIYIYVTHWFLLFSTISALIRGKLSFVIGFFSCIRMMHRPLFPDCWIN